MQRPTEKRHNVKQWSTKHHTENWRFSIWKLHFPFIYLWILDFFAYFKIMISVRHVGKCYSVCYCHIVYFLPSVRDFCSDSVIQIVSFIINFYLLFVLFFPDNVTQYAILIVQWVLLWFIVCAFRSNISGGMTVMTFYCK